MFPKTNSVHENSAFASSILISRLQCPIFPFVTKHTTKYNSIYILSTDHLQPFFSFGDYPELSFTSKTNALLKGSNQRKLIIKNTFNFNI